MLRLLIFIAIMTVAASPLPAEDTYDDGSYDLFLNAGVGRFSGDYGFVETTTMDVLSLSARWYLAKGEIQVSVPYLRIEGPADIRFIGGQPVAVPGLGDEEIIGTDSGLGDAVLHGEYYLLSGTETRPWVIGLLRVKLPTGSEKKGLGTGATDVEAGVGLIQRHGPVHWLADIGYTWVGSSSEFELQNVVRAGAGVSAPFGENELHNAYLYLENRTHLVKGSEDRRSLALGVGTSLDRAERVRVSGSVFVGLSDTAEDYGVYLSLGRRY